MKYYEIRKENLQGVDVSNEITLKEYGFAWHELTRKGIFRFYIGTQYKELKEYSGQFEPTWFEWLELPINVDLEKEYDWCDFSDVASMAGQSVEEWKENSIPSKLYDLISYYGEANFT